VGAEIIRTPAASPKLYNRIWEETGWVPHERQREILYNRTRNQVVSFGRRAGKSQTGGNKLVPEWFRTMLTTGDLKDRGQRREYWIIGPTYSDAEKEFRVAWNALERLGVPLDRPGSYNNPESGQMRISSLSGLFVVHAKSAQHPETLVGEGLSGAVFSEAAKLKPSVWFKYIRPTLADFNGWTYFGSTPEGKNWFYDMWEQGQDPTRTDWVSWRAPAWVNPYVYPGGCDEKLLESAKVARRKGQLREWRKATQHCPNDRDLPESPVGIDPEVWSLFMDQSTEMFNQEIQALFTEYVGRVFKDFDEELHVGDFVFDPTWSTYACADYGFTNPFVWLLVQIDPHGREVRILDEYYETGRTTTEAAAEIASRGLAPRTIRQFFPDPAEPDRTREIAQLLQIRPGRNTGIPLDDRIEWIRRKLKVSVSSGQPELLVHRRCKNTIREFGAYRYPKTAEQAAEKGRSAPEAPMKLDDHTPEALGRLFSGLWGKPSRGAAARQSQVNLHR
jgi:terminase large subunit-like protein